MAVDTAVSRVRRFPVEGEVALDLSAVTGPRGAIGADTAEDVVETLGNRYRACRLTETRVCEPYRPPDPPDCGFVGASAVVSVESMMLGEEVTTVTVRMDYPSGSRLPGRPFYFVTYHVDLVPGTAGWEVAAVRLGAMS